MDEKYLDYLLSTPSEKQEPEEDMMIHQPDGSKACLNWELRGKGYHMVHGPEKSRNYDDMSDEELLKEAYKDLERYEANKGNL